MSRYRPQRLASTHQWGNRSRFGRSLYSSRSIPLHVLELGVRLRAAYRRAEENDRGLRGGNYIYAATSRGAITYIGITNDPDARQVEHGDRFHLHVLNRSHALSRIEVRGIEQAGIDLTRGSAANQNIAESISRARPYYAAAVRFGGAFWEWASATFGGTLRFTFVPD